MKLESFLKSKVLSVAAFAALSAWAGWAPVPSAPGPESWTFKADLARPSAYHAPEAYRIADDYGLTGTLETVRVDLERFMASAGRPAEKTLTLKRGAVDGRESYRVDVAVNGDCTLTAGDDEGLRRAAYYFEDRVSGGDLAPTVRKPWLRNRISRCFFGPIKRPPFNRDELMDDVDYYPDEYLNKLAHEGINGLWLTIELRDIVRTSFNERDRDAPRRIAKLRRTVGKCLRYGIKTWVFCIEPRWMEAGDPLLAKFPPEAHSRASWGDWRVLCPSHPAARQYVEEAFRDLFEQVPGLAGVLNISHGERPTTCLSSIDPVTGERGACPHCADLPPWRIHTLTAESVVKGMRALNPAAEFLSWFYQPQVEFDRASWVADVARHLPEGVTMLYNFESGAVKEQLGRYRPGGDYWLSYTGPAPAFEKVAEAAREANGLIGAKIQVGCSHECATVPFVPVPGLLYRKYAAMRKTRCSTVMQCWYFGNYPGIMNKAAGELAFEDFPADEPAFLERLARPDWGEDAKTLAKFWQDFSDAYAEYPLSNDMQYYGPFHAGVTWPLLPYVEMRPLGRTWKPDPPSGDAIGECLENHTLEEAAILADRMRRGTMARDDAGRDILAELERKYAANPDRLRDLGVVRALRLLFASGADIFEFYRLREEAVVASRQGRDATRAVRAVGRMRTVIEEEKRITSEMRTLSASDSRIGFHSEAEAHQFHPEKLVWRIGELDRALVQLAEIEAELSAGRPYPLSECEKNAPTVRCGDETASTNGFRFVLDFSETGDLLIRGHSPRSPIYLRLYDLCGTSWPCMLRIDKGGCRTKFANVVTPSAVLRAETVSASGDELDFSIVLDARGWGTNEKRCPAWIHFATDGAPLWPDTMPLRAFRLNLDNVYPCDYGRIIRREGK